MCISECSPARNWFQAGIILVIAVGLGLGAPGLRGQGVSSAGGLTVLSTGGGQTLYSAHQSVFVPSEWAAPVLQFQFGFATDETWGPGQLLDSFTVTLQDEAGQRTEVFLTADASGVVWAPPTPGAALIDPDIIERSFIGGLSTQPALAHHLAHEVRVPLSIAFVDQPLRLYFDLFDNQNALASAGWFGKVTIVPEPPVWSVGGLGLLLGFILLRSRPWKRI
jgi:hypothetical protein